MFAFEKGAIQAAMLVMTVVSCGGSVESNSSSGGDSPTSSSTGGLPDGGPEASSINGGTGGTIDGDAASSSEARAPLDGGSECDPFAITFATTCQGCPTDGLTCPCIHDQLGIDFELPRCGSNDRCLTSLDCAFFCENLPDSSNWMQDMDFTNRITTLSSCVAQLESVCSSDGDCNDGKCVGENTAAGGSCSSAGVGSFCIDVSDCKTVRCAVDSAPANPEDPPGGFCTNGQSGEPCFSDADCASGGRCFVQGPGARTCAFGLVGDACAADPDCKSNMCAGNRCVGPTVGGGPCVTDADCGSGSCKTDPSTQRNVCIPQAP